MPYSMEFVKPAEIEAQSFAIIEAELRRRNVSCPANQMPILQRVIHTSADFDYIQNLTFSENAVEKALDALRSGADIITDTNMALSGINKKSLHALGGEAHCFMSDPDVAAEAKRRGITRAMVSMEKAARLSSDNLIFAIGNAPTALIQLEQLIREHQLAPKLIIGVPVGFVNVVEAKELILQSGVPCIVARGNKGGSNIAAAICNALLYQLYRA
ncbi:precorrin-8X methylmutase [Ruminococcus sp.]|uniref:precorrin-8X methylmutase n=1 Tax=Ruminococcus sp. TaxID=41978 RepID=UPI002674A1A1|nr:precorrin-8X methylmutase [Ruminococcus sp.]MEE1397538.1 precorrin-8X methylmutase [Ruminococcus sp.]